MENRVSRKPFWIVLKERIQGFKGPRIQVKNLLEERRAPTVPLEEHRHPMVPFEERVSRLRSAALEERPGNLRDLRSKTENPPSPAKNQRARMAGDEIIDPNYGV
jgi:hypothetical protein